MPIHFRCPHCAKLLALGTRQGGTQILCPLCNRLLTVPRRTEVNVPTTTVMPPDVAQSWWLDAPPLPTAPADAWRPTSNAPPTLPENATAATPPTSVPPPLPEAIVSPAAANKAIAPDRFFTPTHILLLAGAIVVSVLALSVLFVLLKS